MLEVKIENGKNRITGSGNLVEIMAEVQMVIASVHTQLKRANPMFAIVFREMMKLSVNDPDSPLWEEVEGAGVAIVKDKKQGDPHEK